MSGKTSCLSLVLIVLFLIPFNPIIGQFTQQYEGAELTHGIRLGRVESLRESQEMARTDLNKIKSFKANKPEVVPNFFGRRRLESIAEGALPTGADPVRQSGTSRELERIVDPFTVFEGIDQDQSGSGVPDVNGDVSPQYYLEVVNSTLLQTFDHQGNKVGSLINANLLWSPLGLNSAGDPIILFDKGVQRWFLTEFPPSNKVLVAISDTEDPLGGWSVYSFATPRFPDYPKYGIWPEAYVLTTNEGGGNSIKFYFINREDILQGEDLVRIQRFTVPRLPEPSFQVATPVDWIGTLEPEAGLGPLVVRINDDGWGASQEDKIEIYEATIDWENEANTVVDLHEVVTQPFDSEFCSVPGAGFSCIPQPNGQGIDGIPWVIMHKVQFRNFGDHGSLVLNFTVDASGSDVGGIRWMELRKPIGEGWTMYQEGTYAPDDQLHRFMGGISIDSEGNIGLAYSVSGDQKHASLRFTGRRAIDPLGVMSVREVEFATGGGSIDHDRFGDYASMSVDESDNFWYAGEYIPSNGFWSTKIVGFKITPDTHDLAPISLVAPKNSADLTDQENVSVDIQNQGTANQDSFYIGYILGSGDPVIELILLDSLKRDSTYSHSFVETVDMSVIGSYSFRIFSDLWNDQNRSNDTIRITRQKIPYRDAGIVDIAGLGRVICDSSASFDIVLQNFGQDTLFSAELIFQVEGFVSDTILWEGTLAYGEIELIPAGFTGIPDGEQRITCFVRNPNGEEDQTSTNDSLSLDFRIQSTASLITLSITTDNFPGETLWEVLDESGNTLYSGGPYLDANTNYTEELCLDTSACFSFVLYDTFGDGLTGGPGGNYEISNPDGILLASLLDPDFGESVTNQFCPSLNCQLRINALIAHETAPGATNGTINIFATNGQAPILFSINGGQSLQSGSFYSNLAPGEYIIYVKEGAGCIAIDTIRILECDMEIMANITGVSNPDSTDGALEIIVSGNNGKTFYSIDGGPFQSSPVFYALGLGTHTITVRDSVNCRVSMDLDVEIRTGIVNQISSGQPFVRIAPNPSVDAFNIEVFGADHILQAPVEVLSMDGKVVNRGSLGNYSGVLKGIVSLRSHPPGMYFLRVKYAGFQKLYRLVKI